MADLYRITRPNGSVEYTDRPSGEGAVDAIKSDGRRPVDKDPRQHDYEQARTLIREAQKRIPKFNDYMEYVQYIRDHGQFWRIEEALETLRTEDPQVYWALRKYPQFQPLHNTALGLRAGEKHLAAGIGLATGNVTGSVERWLESTVKDMMKRDRYGSYADVLGSKASTLPAPQPAVYSNSRLGQHLKVEDARAARAANEVARDLESSRAAIRSTAAMSTTRVLNPLLDLGIGALDTDFFRGISAIEGMRLGKRLVDKGILTPEEALDLRGMMARAEFDKARSLIEAGIQRAGAAR